MDTTKNRTALISVIALLLTSTACGACSTAHPQPAQADECEPGYVAITRDDPQHPPMTFCLAGPDYCKTAADCRADYACEKNSGTFTTRGSGVCMPDTVAVLQRIQ